MARHAEFMELIAENQIKRHIKTCCLLSASASKARLASMLKRGN